MKHTSNLTCVHQKLIKAIPRHIYASGLNFVIQYQWCIRLLLRCRMASFYQVITEYLNNVYANIRLMFYRLFEQDFNIIRRYIHFFGLKKKIITYNK